MVLKYIFIFVLGAVVGVTLQSMILYFTDHDDDFEDDDECDCGEKCECDSENDKWKIIK